MIDLIPNIVNAFQKNPGAMITARYDGIPVEVQDVFRSGGAILAVVKTLDGSQPFVGGDKWPVKQDFDTVLAAELEDITEVENA